MIYHRKQGIRSFNVKQAAKRLCFLMHFTIFGVCSHAVDRPSAEVDKVTTFPVNQTMDRVLATDISGTQKVARLAQVSDRSLTAINASRSSRGRYPQEHPLRPANANPQTDPDIFETDSPAALPIANVTVTLYPNTKVEIGTAQTLIFGIPFPPGTLERGQAIEIHDQFGNSLPTFYENSVFWYDERGAPTSVRGVIVQLDVVFSSAEAVEVSLSVTDTNSNEITGLDAEKYWVPIQQGEYPDEFPVSEALKEPAAYAVLPAAWLSLCGVRSQTIPVGMSLEFAWFDEAYEGFSHTAVGDVSELVTDGNRIDFAEEYSPWLLDRASTLFGVYIRTGKAKWLRSAHRSALYYANHISDDGYFDKKPRDKRGRGDLKYSYGQSLLAELLITGNKAMIPKIEAVADAWENWDPVYTHRTQGRTFWTERHQSLALLAALTAWEATGSLRHSKRAREIVEATIAQSRAPENGWLPQGAPLHSFKAHEGWGSNDPVASPWMLALLGEAMERYHHYFNHRATLEWLADLDNYLLQYGTYVQGPEMGDWKGLTVPYYLGSSSFKKKTNRGWDDHNHACAVATLAFRSAYANARLTRENTKILNLANSLKKTCDVSMRFWRRSNANKHGKTVWRLGPARMYNWRFGSTLGMPLLETKLNVSKQSD